MRILGDKRYVAYYDQGDEEQIAQLTGDLCAQEQGRRFILSGGCEITVSTPHANLKAMREASR